MTAAAIPRLTHSIIAATTPMQKFLAALTLGVFALAHGPIFAQDKKSEPAKEEVKKAEAKDEKTDTKKETKKKVKKGGC